MAKNPQAPAKGKNAFARILLLSLALAFVLVFLPTVLFVAVGMWADRCRLYRAARNPDKYEWICVGGLNFAGCMPFLLRFWRGRHTVETARAMLTDVFHPDVGVRRRPGSAGSCSWRCRRWLGVRADEGAAPRRQPQGDPAAADSELGAGNRQG